MWHMCGNSFSLETRQITRVCELGLVVRSGFSLEIELTTSFKICVKRTLRIACAHLLAYATYPFWLKGSVYKPLSGRAKVAAFASG